MFMYGLFNTSSTPAFMWILFLKVKRPLRVHASFELANALEKANDLQTFPFWVKSILFLFFKPVAISLPPPQVQDCKFSAQT